MGASWIANSQDTDSCYEYHTCQCLDWGTTETCTECNGRGAVRFAVDPESMHLGYGNSIALTRALGFACDDEAYTFDFTYDDVKYIASRGIELLRDEMRERYYIPLSRLCAVALYHKSGINWG